VEKIAGLTNQQLCGVSCGGKYLCSMQAEISLPCRLLVAGGLCYAAAVDSCSPQAGILRQWDLCSWLDRLAHDVVEQKSTRLPPGSSWCPGEGGIVSAASPQVGQAPCSFSVTELSAVHEAMATDRSNPRCNRAACSMSSLTRHNWGPEKLIDGQLGPWEGGQRMRPGGRQRAPSCVTEGLCGAVALGWDGSKRSECID
jgi:hypothetical protein